VLFSVYEGHLGLPAFDLVEIQIGRVRLHAVAPENKCLPEAIATTESIGSLLAALASAEQTEGHRLAN
jgi:hypothetical protein